MTDKTPAMPELPDGATVLPDGSAFAIASFPLPANHWLYAPREYRDGEEDPIELPSPILSHQAHGDVVRAAIRYAVRGATMCGKEPDFDPDALVQNAMYALCGPFGGAALQSAQPAAPQYNGWYCAHCQRGVDASEVTFHEQHTVCGRVITNDAPPALQPAAAVSDEELQAIDDAHNWQTTAGRHAAYRAILALRPQAVPMTDERRREDFMAGYAAAEQDAAVCQVPHFGWRCTREAGHEGPCAAVETDDAELVQRGMDRLREARHGITQRADGGEKQA